MDAQPRLEPQAVTVAGPQQQERSPEYQHHHAPYAGGLRAHQRRETAPGPIGCDAVVGDVLSDAVRPGAEDGVHPARCTVASLVPEHSRPVETLDRFWRRRRREAVGAGTVGLACLILGLSGESWWIVSPGWYVFLGVGALLNAASASVGSIRARRHHHPADGAQG